jgi:hypothetical protein
LADCNFILAANLGNYAARLIEQGEFARAADPSGESLKLFQAHRNHDGAADCLGHLGRLALLRGDLVQARSLFDEVIRLQTFSSPANLCAWRILPCNANRLFATVQKIRSPFAALRAGQ